MQGLIDCLCHEWRENQKYAQQMLADIPADQLYTRPLKNAGHPAWLLSHLCLYQEVLLGMCADKPFPDPKSHPHFSFGKEPVSDPALYLPKDQLLAKFVKGHEQVEADLRQVGPVVFDRPMSLERWKKGFPTNGPMILHLMLVHESQHLGQISYWRRAMGFGRVGM